MYHFFLIDELTDKVIRKVSVPTKARCPKADDGTSWVEIKLSVGCRARDYSIKNGELIRLSGNG